ncbi:MAG: ATP-dependent helicase [Candidatus Spechtbacteria bacterium]|nr:ATP-dependent helicase [Candidatus Spechtbacteria bacterium]
MSSFDTLYQKLNPEQKQAVDTLDGPVMVIAGPGTGKTQILALRIANILRQKKIAPQRILALTFSEAGVSAMRKRLSELIGTQGYYVTVLTFHSFCNALIQRYPEDFPQVGTAENVSEVEQVQLLEQIFDNTPLSLLRPFGDPYFYIKSALAEISTLKREGVTPAALSELVEKEHNAFLQIDDLYHEKGAHEGKMKGKYQDQEKFINKNRELVVVYERYQQELAQQKRYDYNDMILFVVKKLQNDENFRMRVSEAYDYILVDEHQDTNNGQNNVLALLCSENEAPNLFVVGDEKQAIFRFQGATLANFLYFHKRFSGAKLITLHQNYRSSQPILDGAMDLIKQNQSRISNILPEVNDALYANREGSYLGPPGGPRYEPKKPIEFWEFADTQSENYFIGKKIEELIANGVDPREIAVLVREHESAVPVTSIFAKLGIPYVWESQHDMLEDAQVKKILSIMRYAVDFGSDEKLLPVLHIDTLGIPPIDIYRLFAYRNKIEYAHHRHGVLGIPYVDNLDSKKKTDDVKPTVIELMGATQVHKKLHFENSPAIFHAYSLLSGIRQDLASENALVLFERIVREGKFLDIVKQNGDDPRMMAGIHALFRELKNFLSSHPSSGGTSRKANLADFLQHLDLVEKHNIKIKTSSFKASLRAVRVMSVHGAKGLEFDYVFVPNAADSKWGGRVKPRLFRLPQLITASEEGLTLLKGGSDPPRPSLIDTDPKIDKYEDERRLFFVALTRARHGAHISCTLLNDAGREQIPTNFISEIRSELVARGGTEAYELEAQQNPALFFSSSIATTPPLQEREFVAELFTKRGLPVTAFNNYLECPWKYFYINLLRVPHAPSKQQMYGTAIHAGLHDFFERLKTDANTPKEFLLERFNFALATELLNEHDYQSAKARGEETLDKYYEEYRGAWNKNTENERSISIPLSDIIRLTGKLDKLEIQPNGYDVIVVDYKTGHSKTRGEIEGTTKNSNGNLKRQLVFYKLLLDKYPLAKYNMLAGELDFIEPDAKGKLHKEQFVISQENVTALEAEIHRVAEEIISIAFWDKRCSDKACGWCALRK